MLIASMTLQLGCDPEQRISVNTVDEMGRAVGGLRLELYCPAERPWQLESVDELGTTDSSGRLLLEEVGSTPTRCVVCVAGRKSSIVKVESVCTKRTPLLRSCVSFEASVVVAQ
jgi:hypothetical protein